ncbi:MAG: XRE family transcriptional regulator [Bdellovibrio sp.]|nr:XRE family transcriptional regulator [Bdellovibrio sp.]
MKMKRYKTIEEFGKDLGVTSDRVLISKMKTTLKKRIIKETEVRELTCAELAEASGLSRTVVSGIVNGSLQSVSIERLIRLASALSLSVELNIRDVA